MISILFLFQACLCGGGYYDGASIFLPVSVFASGCKTIFSGHFIAKYGIKRAGNRGLFLLYGEAYLVPLTFIFKSHTFRHMFRGALQDRVGIMGNVEA